MEIIDKKRVIWKAGNFVVLVVERPFISREEGGHLMIQGTGDKFRYNSCLDFSPEEALEESRFKQIVCEAYVKAMKNRGIDIIRINFFEAGNWAWKPGGSGKAFFHEHIFGRVVDAKYQKFPDAPYLPDRSTGFYDNFEPLKDEDILEIQKEIEEVLRKEKYKIENWKI